MQHRVMAEIVGTVHSVDVHTGSQVSVGDVVVVLESMKMEIPVLTEVAGTVVDVQVGAGETVREGDVLAVVEA